MRALSVIILLAALVFPSVAFAEVQTFTATHTYIMGAMTDNRDKVAGRITLAQIAEAQKQARE